VPESGGYKIVFVFFFILVFISLMHNFDDYFVFNMPPIYYFNCVPLYYNAQFGAYIYKRYVINRPANAVRSPYFGLPYMLVLAEVRHFGLACLYFVPDSFVRHHRLVLGQRRRFVELGRPRSLLMRGRRRLLSSSLAIRLCRRHLIGPFFPRKRPRHLGRRWPQMRTPPIGRAAASRLYHHLLKRNH
jgi:hypothetical protein